MVANARVETEKSSRYLQALGGHFSRKVNADYNAEQGHIDFGFGVCELHTEPGALVLHVDAPDAEALTRVKDTMSRHLERFAAKDNLRVEWDDNKEEATC